MIWKMHNKNVRMRLMWQLKVFINLLACQFLIIWELWIHETSLTLWFMLDIVSNLNYLSIVIIKPFNNHLFFHASAPTSFATCFTVIVSCTVASLIFTLLCSLLLYSLSPILSPCKYCSKTIFSCHFQLALLQPYFKK